MLSWSVAWDEIAQSNGRQRDETIIQRVQVIPVAFQAGKNSRGNQENQRDDQTDELKSVTLTFLKSLASTVVEIFACYCVLSQLLIIHLTCRGETWICIIFFLSLLKKGHARKHRVLSLPPSLVMHHL